MLNHDALVIDTRPATEFARGHVPGTLNIPLNGSFVTWAGWLVPYTADFYVIVDDGPAERLTELRRALSLVGLDRVAGYFSDAGHRRRGGTRNDARDDRSDHADQLRAALESGLPADVAVIDVRSANEWNEGHLPSAIHIPLGHLADRIAEVPADRQVVVHCQARRRDPRSRHRC